MLATGYPFQMVGSVPVITAPAKIDRTTVGELRSILCEWQSRGHATVVVDMTGTVFCDAAGLRELVRAHRQAAADGGGLRLVMAGDGTCWRIFTRSGLDAIIPHDATLAEALAQVPDTAIRAMRRGPARQSAATWAGSSAHLRADGQPTEGRTCDQCSAVFVPPREHARFCSSECRAAWNRDHLGDPVVEPSALAWSIAAMTEATARLPAVKVWDQQRAFVAIGEAVWWITMVDATLVRHHSGIYGNVMAARDPAGRQMIEETLAGLRFVRNWISRGAQLGEVIEAGAGDGRITLWSWRPTPEPALTWLPPSAQAWERARYLAYQARLAGHPIGKTFRQAVTFLTLTGADAAPADASQRAVPG
jgi:anti-sigma B factor antagonist